MGSGGRETEGCPGVTMGSGGRETEGCPGVAMGSGGQETEGCPGVATGSGGRETEGCPGVAMGSGRHDIYAYIRTDRHECKRTVGEGHTTTYDVQQSHHIYHSAGGGVDRPVFELWVWLATSGRKGVGFGSPVFEWWVLLVTSSRKGRGLAGQVRVLGVVGDIW